jgi:hypothetical protein
MNGAEMLFVDRRLSEPHMATKKRETQITSAFGAIFRRIRRREPFASPPIDQLADRMFEALVAAALAKCVEFNVAANRVRRHTDEEFVFVSALRGICEDLISLVYFSKMPVEKRKEITTLLIARTLAKGLEVQRAFFESNNPFQPVLGPPKAEGTQLSSSLATRQALREFWAGQGTKQKDGPTIKDMASEVGLTFTYDYIYFASSNFVHFNPQALLRMGWGDLEQPFRFSVSHIRAYYKALASFYGAILFIGYHSAFWSSQFRVSCERDVASLLDLIEEVPRWPEVITFEEMNKKPPVYLITHALRRVVPEEGAPGGILAEVRGLGTRLNPGCV